MSKGTLAFSMDGENMGVAVTDSRLTKGPICPAVCFYLDGQGCSISDELPIP